MTRRQVLEAISCVLPMSGMVTGQLGWRAMQLVDAAPKKTPKKLHRKGRGGRKGK